MNDHGDQLRRAFETHENLAPDAAVVYARVRELSQTYKRRRRGAQAAGGAVLGVGLIAGAINLPGMLQGGGAQQPATFSVAAPASPSPSVDPEAVLEAEWAAYFGAGYGYNDAVKLAELWNLPPENIGEVKAEAGRRILAGETLPIQPSPDPTPSEPSDDEIAEFQERMDAYFGAGYDWDDAVELAELWNLEDPSDAKVEAGKKLLAGETLPIQP